MRIRTGNGMRLTLMATVVTIAALLQAGAWGTACDPNFVTQAGNVFTVLPTGTDDTANIQCALNEAAALGAGSTVQLACGTYFTGMIEVTGFNGTFAGEGKDATIIHSLPNLPCGDVPYPDWPSLFIFHLAHLKVADLTVDITDPAPCLPFWAGQMLEGLICVTDLSSSVTGCAEMPGPSTAGLTVERVGFKGVGNVDDGYNVDVALVFAPECWGVQTHMLAGDFVVTKSTFERANIAMVANQIADSTVRIGGSPSMKNTTYDVHQPVLIQDFQNSAVEISHNELEGNWAVIQACQGNSVELTAPSTFLVSHNIVRSDIYADGMFLSDWTSPYIGKMLVADVADNDFIMDNGGCCGAINAWWNTRDVLVRNNRFTGVTGYGAAIGFIRRGTDTGWTLVGNNFNFDYVDFVPVYLGPYSSGCTIVGGKNKFNVYDLGVGNIITGVNNMQGDPPGPNLSEAVQNKLDRMKLHR
jgi:hypothetical protein